MEKLGRLQPSAYLGVSCSRTSGSLTARRRWRWPTRSPMPATGSTLWKCAASGNVSSTKVWLTSRLTCFAPGTRKREPGGQRHHRVELGQAPDRRALEDGQVRDVAGDRRDHLHRRCPGADDRHPLAGEVDVVVPARGVHDGAGELVDAVDLGELGLGQHSGRAHDVAGRDRVAVGGPEPPAVAVVVEGCGHDPGVEPGPPAHVVLVDAVLGVVLQLAPRRVDPRPPGHLLERELVAERRDVDRHARIGVPVPRTADAVTLLDHQVVVEARLVEQDRGTDAGEAAADDGDVVVGSVMHAIRSSRAAGAATSAPSPRMMTSTRCSMPSALRTPCSTIA